MKHCLAAGRGGQTQQARPRERWRPAASGPASGMERCNRTQQAVLAGRGRLVAFALEP